MSMAHTLVDDTLSNNEHARCADLARMEDQETRLHSLREQVQAPLFCRGGLFFVSRAPLTSLRFWCLGHWTSLSTTSTDIHRCTHSLRHAVIIQLIKPSLGSTRAGSRWFQVHLLREEAA